MSSTRLFRCFLILFVFGFIGMILFGLMLFNDPESNKVGEGNEDEAIHKMQHNGKIQQDINVPIFLWWTPFTGDPGSYKQCGSDQCFFTVNRHYRNHSMTKGFFFYGSDFDTGDLPLPRKPHHEWALLHEESPKNNFLFSHADIMTMFNFTSTFKRQSSYPITTQYLLAIDWLESKKYLVPTKQKNKYLEELAPLFYAHSDCDVPSDRDHYVKMLQKYIKVDSYGKCIHNKDLPEHLTDAIKGMDHSDFYKLIGKYKFSLAMENAICDDYITEKLWRPLMVGSVPIVMGSSKIKEFLPSNYSAIVVDDFPSVQKLAEYLIYLNHNDEEYNKYLRWKEDGVTNTYLREVVATREWSVQDDIDFPRTKEIDFIDGFSCYVCKEVHKNIRRADNGKVPVRHSVTVDHYGCPMPMYYDTAGKRKSGKSLWQMNDVWQSEWIRTSKLAKEVRKALERN